MNRKIIVNHKEFKMEKMSADTYMEYLELAEQIDAATSERASKRYSRQEIEAMMLFICKDVYKRQPLDIKLSDSQFFELKKYTALQIAAAFGVKPNQINDY